MLPFEYFSADGNAVAAGIFIPVAALPGVTSDRLESGDTDKESVVVNALLAAMYTALSPQNVSKLGVSVAKANPIGAGSDLINQNYSATFQYLANLETNAISPVPVPGSGANANLGGITIAQSFQGATKVAANGATGGAGVLIPTAELVEFGSRAHNVLTTNQDERSWYSALWLWIVENARLRSAQNASAILAASRSAAQGVSIPANFTASVNPVSGIAAADLPKRALFQIAFAVTLQLSIETADVRNVVA